MAKFDEQDGRPVAALVELLVSQMADDLMTPALQAAAIPRQSDVKLFRHLLDDPGIKRTKEECLRPTPQFIVR